VKWGASRVQSRQLTCPQQGRSAILPSLAPVEAPPVTMLAQVATLGALSAWGTGS